MMKNWIIIILFSLVGCSSNGQQKQETVRQSKPSPSLKRLEQQNKHPIFEGIPVGFNEEKEGFYQSIDIEADPYTKIFKPSKKIWSFDNSGPGTLLEYYLKIDTKELYDSLFLEGFIPAEMPIEFQLGPSPNVQFHNLGSMGIGTETHFYDVYKVRYIDRYGFDKGIRYLLFTNILHKKMDDFFGKEISVSGRWYLLNDIYDQEIKEKVEDPVIKMLIDWAMRFDYQKGRYFFNSIKWLKEHRAEVALTEEEYEKLMALKNRLSGAEKPRTRTNYLFSGFNYSEEIEKERIQFLWPKMEEVFRPTSSGYNEGVINFLFEK